ncbi:hypothetical protein [Oricola thermophila]|uniref:Uncharacterized protein n=1 Tax=Oricola thermophila TaxID=2742145 RepID=A0A6N1VBB4_9HYPH|nr:hypothetical protein [Oricola thermophila]QKV17843.1 hypothetical protein HTY61_04905 [Oricola thermophila]
MNPIEMLKPHQIETLQNAFGDRWEAEVAFYARAYGPDFVKKLFPKTDSFRDRWNIHKSEWARVKFKARVKKVVKAAEEAGREINRIYISPQFGSVYIDLVIPNDELDVETIRVSDHERTSADHPNPDFNIFDASSFKDAVERLAK